MESEPNKGLVLKSKWTELCNGLGLTDDIIDTWWKVVENNYSEKQRHYHTLNHLLEMLTHFDTWKNELKDLLVVVLAIFFHDIVYQPKSSTNEQDSILLFRDFASKANLDAGITSKTVKLIDFTITHETDGHTDRDQQFFLDFDMAVLARPADDYDEYAAQIKAEYSHIEASVYNVKRTRVLQNFLSRDHIFATTEFQKQYEHQARANIAREISLLSSK